MTFVIAGPATVTNSVNQLFFGVPRAAAGTGINVNQVGTCQTDVFTVSNSLVPPLCGTLTGDHGEYVEIFALSSYKIFQLFIPAVNFRKWRLSYLFMPNWLGGKGEIIS